MTMSAEAEALWTEIKGKYVSQGYPYVKEWLIPSNLVGINELAALGLIESRSVGGATFGLTSDGVDEIIDSQRMSDGAFSLLKETAKRYAAANFPPIQSWIVAAAPPVNELVARGFFAHFAIGGHAILTSHGRQWIIDNRDDKPAR